MQEKRIRFVVAVLAPILRLLYPVRKNRFRQFFLARLSRVRAGKRRLEEL